MKLTFINVGNGDSILVEFPDARFRSGCFVMVIDGGSGEDEEYRENHTGRIRAVDYLEQAGIDHIDCMVSTHIHEDHTCGLLAIAEKWTPSCFFQPFHAGLAHSMRELSAKPEDRESTRKFIASLNAYQKLVLGIEERGGKIHCLRQGEVQELCGAGEERLAMHVLGPAPGRLGKQEERFAKLYGEEQPGQKRNGERLCADQENSGLVQELDREMNDVSLILLLEALGQRILLPGDTGRDGYPGRGGASPSAAEKLQADIFKTGHHGQGNSLDLPLLREISPVWAVICASSDRRYNSADPEILKLLRENGTEILFTDCPNVPPYTDGLAPHQAVSLKISDEGVKVEYENCDGRFDSDSPGGKVPFSG